MYISTMILYNVTLILDADIEADWLDWMHTEHIAEVMATGCFSAKRMLKVLDSPNEGVTYCMQYIADNMEQCNHYQTEFAPTYWLAARSPASVALAPSPFFKSLISCSILIILASIFFSNAFILSSNSFLSIISLKSGIRLIEYYH